MSASTPTIMKKMKRNIKLVCPPIVTTSLRSSNFNISLCKNDSGEDEDEDEDESEGEGEGEGEGIGLGLGLGAGSASKQTASSYVGI